MVSREGCVGKENFFTPSGRANLTPELVAWREIREAYLMYSTKESLDRMTGLNRAATALEKEGLAADLLIGGS